jgi:hypothetical protein
MHFLLARAATCHFSPSLQVMATAQRLLQARSLVAACHDHAFGFTTHGRSTAAQGGTMARQSQAWPAVQVRSHAQKWFIRMQKKGKGHLIPPKTVVQSRSPAGHSGKQMGGGWMSGCGDDETSVHSPKRLNGGEPNAEVLPLYGTFRFLEPDSACSVQ